VRQRALLSYFESDIQQRNALGAVARRSWLAPSENLNLYDISRRAFDPALSAEEEFHVIYETLVGRWQVFRPRSSRDCWSSRRVFNKITGEFSEFSWRGSVSLLTPQDDWAHSRLRSPLAGMRGIKRKNGYPHMTVSKFLHFYNPGLFPIYDTAVIWNKVFKHFRNDFRDYCVRKEIPYNQAINDDTEAFLLQYMGWASFLLSARHRNFMQVFVDWLDQQEGAALSSRGFDPHTLYATAFEFTAIGATEAS
jgi:hypothetical protein